MSFTQPNSTPHRIAWPLQALDSNRQGDLSLLQNAFDKTTRPHSNINVKTTGGAYGGYKFPTWSKQSIGGGYGGNPGGETLLHLSLRTDNSFYPNRYSYAKCLISLGIKTFEANDDGLPARMLNADSKLLMDAVHPIGSWSVDDVAAWVTGLGEWATKNKQWVEHFAVREVDGQVLLSWLPVTGDLNVNLTAEEEKNGVNLTFFGLWLENTHYDLSHREAYAVERRSIKDGLTELLVDFKKSNIFRRVKEKPGILEERRRRKKEERKERVESVLMFNEEDEQVCFKEVVGRQRKDSIDEKAWTLTESNGLYQIERLEASTRNLHQKIEAGIAVARKVLPSEGLKPKQRKMELQKLQVEKEGAAENVSRWQDALIRDEASLAEVQHEVTSGMVFKSERSDFLIWLTLPQTRREQALQRVLTEVEFESLEEKLADLPASIVKREDRINKLAFTRKRNELKDLLEGVYGGAFEDMVIKEKNLYVSVLDREMRFVKESGREIEMSGKLEDEEEILSREARFIELEHLRERVKEDVDRIAKLKATRENAVRVEKARLERVERQRREKDKKKGAGKRKEALAKQKTQLEVLVKNRGKLKKINQKNLADHNANDNDSNSNSDEAFESENEDDESSSGSYETDDDETDNSADEEGEEK